MDGKLKALIWACSEDAKPPANVGVNNSSNTQDIEAIEKQTVYNHPAMQSRNLVSRLQFWIQCYKQRGNKSQ